VIVRRAKPKRNNDLESLSEADRADYEERAAIMEFEGGLSTHQAERAALAIVRGRKAQGRFCLGI